MPFLKPTLFLIYILFLFPSDAFCAQDFSKVEIKTHKVEGGIYFLEGSGGNIGVSSGEDGIYIIDDQFSGLNEKILKALKKITDKSIRYVINTHWHGDHTGGNELFSKSGSVLIAHENVRKRMSIENFNKVFNRKTPPASPSALPEITFPDRLKLHLNGETAEVIHFSNAHTDGDSVIYFKKSNVIHTGDIFFNGFYPFIDVDSGGSLDGVISAVEKIIKLADSKTKIIPGHGKLGTHKDLKNYLKLLKSFRLKFKELIAKGMSEEEILKINPLSEYDLEFGQGFMKPQVFRGIVYRSLKGNG